VTERSSHTNVTAAILAGGRARRLDGADKSALVFDGERTIDRQVAALRTITDSIIVVGGDDTRFESTGVRVVPDLVSGAGALGGIYSALAHSKDPRTLIVACDMPFLNVTVLERLVRPAAPDVDVVMPRTHDGLQPLCAVYANRLVDVIRQRIDRGLLKIVDLAEVVRIEEIGPEELATYDPGRLMFVNVNTPHDYERAKGLLDLSRRSPDLSRRSSKGAKAEGAKAEGDRITNVRTTSTSHIT
jgi:molybdopterin-guanine dinucleotide biosynthesis protein A